MTRILVFGMTENPGGVESFLMNYYRRIDRRRVQFDFLCNSHDPVAYEDELLALGGRTFHITARSKDPLRYRKELFEVFRAHSTEWAAIWVNVSSLANIDYLVIAKRFGIERRIIHSHNAQNMDSPLRGVLHKLNRLRVGGYATDFWACSASAADWFYRKGLREKAVVIRNAIDVERMRFDPEKRAAIRAAYGLTDRLVIGNVGRLHFQKNQTFLLDIFAAFTRHRPDSVLALVGGGEDEAMLKDKAARLGVSDRVIFAGVQSDIPAWLSGFDLFLFPSLFEGLSIAALEAQANGVPVLASARVIPAEVRMNPNFTFFDLNASPEAWAAEAMRLLGTGREPQTEIAARFCEKGYDIAFETERLMRLLLA